MPESTENMTPRSIEREKKNSVRAVQMFSRVYQRISFLESKEDIFAINDLFKVSEIKDT